MSDWKHVGVVCVDSGLIFIADPCRVFSEDSCEHFTDWGSFIDSLESDGHPALGVCISPGFGDGIYDVYAKYKFFKGWGKRISEIKIVFIEEEEDK